MVEAIEVVITMTNRLLSMVIALALSSGIVAHAAQAPHRPLTPVSLPDAIQTAASKVSETATGAVDPAAAIRGAYQRNHVALEHLRQQASPLKGSARATVDQLISDQEVALTETQRTALATRRPAASSAIAEMDKLVGAADEEVNRELSKARDDNSNNSKQPTHSQSNGQSADSDKAGQSDKSGQSDTSRQSDKSGQSNKSGQSDKSGQSSDSRRGDN